jgi:hypothetical protein
MHPCEHCPHYDGMLCTSSCSHYPEFLERERRLQTRLFMLACFALASGIILYRLAVGG